MTLKKHPSGFHVRAAIVGILCCLLLSAWCPLALTATAVDIPATTAVTEAAPTEDRVGSVYLCNLENNLILYEKNSTAKVYPASSVKIMTGLLACRALVDRQDEAVTVTAAMLSGASGRTMGLQIGEVLTIRDLLYATLCGGYNDAACVLACLSSGSVVSFVEEMNREAARIGAAATNYTNPTGLHDEAMATTAADTALVAREAWQNELFMACTSAVNYTIPATNTSDERYFSNRNSLLSDRSGTYYNGYCQGMNAGMIDESVSGIGGWCVVTVWEKNGASNLAIVMEGADVDIGEDVPAYRYVNRLLAWADRNYGYRRVLTEGEVFSTHPVTMTGIGESEADLVVPQDVLLYLPKSVDLASALTFNYTLNGDELTAPLTEGERVGMLTVTYQGQAVGSVPLIVTESFERNGFLDFLASSRSYLTSRAFMATVVCFVILVLIYLKWTTGPGRRYGVRDVRRRTVRYRRQKRRYRY